MCTRYISPDTAAIERHWYVGRDNAWRGGELFPRAPGAFIRAARHSAEPERELVVGQWGLIPWFAKEARLGYSTVNARFEEITSKASYKDPWRYGKRCVIPAVVVRRAELGVRSQRLVALPAGRWHAVGLGGAMEHLDRQGHRRVDRLVHHADDQRRRAPVDAAHAQARPEARR